MAYRKGWGGFYKYFTGRIAPENAELESVYPEKYADTYGYFRPVIADVVRKYLVCGDLKKGFARVRCDESGHEYLLSFSCKGRYFCTSCYTKRAVAFSEWLNDTVLWAVPHRPLRLGPADAPAGHSEQVDIQYVPFFDS